MKRSILLMVLIGAAGFAMGQIRATTESGNKVLLFDDGTWKYEEKKVSVTPTDEKPGEPVTAIAVTEVKVDKTRDVKTEAETLFYTQSPRLVRYFGEEKGRIRCKVSCSNKLGEVRIHYHWDMQVGDGQRYFGYMRSGTILTFHMDDGKKIQVVVEEDSKLVASEKYNKSSLSGTTQVLSNEQLKALLEQPVDKLEVDWKKKPEKYELEDPKYFMDTLPKVF